LVKHYTANNKDTQKSVAMFWHNMSIQNGCTLLKVINSPIVAKKY